MSAPSEPHTVDDIQAPATSLLALDCARNVCAAVDHRSPEANALASWLVRHAAGLGFGPDAFPEEWAGTHASLRRGVAPEAWQRIGSVLQEGGPDNASSAPIMRWVAAIDQRLRLGRLSSSTLALVLHYPLDQRVSGLIDTLREARGWLRMLRRDPSLFALLLGESRADLTLELGVGGRLVTSGLLHLDRRGVLRVHERLVSLIRQEVLPAGDILDQLLGVNPVTPLPWEAFAHLGREAEIAASVLRAALDAGEKGVGILLYGPPGTGKTSFAASLAARIGATLRSVAEADEDGDEPSRHDRLSALRLAQRLSAGGGALLLFDEAEDLFVRRSVEHDEPATSSRVFIHRLLEELPVPMLWTANDIASLGPAVLRRMTMCLELKVPAIATRATLWRQMAQAEGIMMQDSDARRLAGMVAAAPAVAAGALRAARLAGGGIETTRLVVEGVARAVSGGRIAPPEPEPDAAYDPDLLNADCDLIALTDTLRRPGGSRSVSFLLSGPPGVGKSAWIRHLADQIGMPVLPRRASDILDPFLGGTEQKIAEAFAEAREARAFLVFDEIDSLLLARKNAVRSWEITQVNEMLTWMETHPLPFACTTNMPDLLDPASLRRFVVKIRFDYLDAGRARLAFQRFFALEPPIGLERLPCLTPADFALVRRRAALLGLPSDPVEIVQRLGIEAAGRVGTRVSVGFAHPVAAA